MPRPKLGPRAFVGQTADWRMVWFACSAGAARMALARAYDVSEPFNNDFRVRRAPAMDCYLAFWEAHEDVPAEAWWAAGYMASCGECGDPVAQGGGCGDDECYHEGQAVVVDDRAYHGRCAPGMGR